MGAEDISKWWKQYLEKIYRGEYIINEDDYIGKEYDVEVNFKASPIRKRVWYHFETT